MNILKCQENFIQRFQLINRLTDVVLNIHHLKTAAK